MGSTYISQEPWSPQKSEGYIAKLILGAIAIGVLLPKMARV